MKNVRTRYILLALLANTVLFYLVVPLGWDIVSYTLVISLYILIFYSAYRILKMFYNYLLRNRSARLGNIIMGSFAVSGALFLLDLILYSNTGISLRGNLSDRLLCGCFLLSFVVLVIYNWKSVWLKTFVGISAAIAVLGIITMRLSLFAFILWFTGGGVDFSKKLSDKYRVQIYLYDFLGHENMDIAEGFGIFEKDLPQKFQEVKSLPVYRIKDIDYLHEDKDSIYLKITDENNNLHTAGFPEKAEIKK